MDSKINQGTSLKKKSYKQEVTQALRCLGGLSLALVIAFELSGCGSSSNKDGQDSAAAAPGPVILRAVATVPLDTSDETTTPGNQQNRAQQATGSTATVSVTQGASTSMTVSTASFGAPTTITPFAANSFGSLSISALQDNNIRSCGTNGTTRCVTAGIMMYTTAPSGVTNQGAGLWNSADAYGLPITAGKGTSLSTVGYLSSSGTVMQSFTIVTTRNTVRLSDFTTPTYNVSVDFTDAGTGTFGAILNLAYYLQ